MLTPLVPLSFVNLTGQIATALQPEDAPASQRQGRNDVTYCPIITGCSIVTGLLLVSSLNDLPLVMKLCLGGTLALVLYGMVVASFRQMRLWLLVGLVSLTLLNLLPGLSSLDFEGNRQAMFWAKSASEELHGLFSHPEQYHVLMDELFISQACWKKHSSQLKPLKHESLR